MRIGSKLLFFNSGFAAALAVLLALQGHVSCFGFGLWAALEWHIANILIVKGNE